MIPDSIPTGWAVLAVLAAFYAGGTAMAIFAGAGDVDDASERARERRKAVKVIVFPPLGDEEEVQRMVGLAESLGGRS